MDEPVNHCDPTEGFCDLAVTFAERLQGSDIIAADMALEAARRIVWTAVYSGSALSAFIDPLNGRPLALRIAADLEGLDIDHVYHVLYRTRRIAWGATCSRIEGSNYARLTKAVREGRVRGNTSATPH